MMGRAFVALMVLSAAVAVAAEEAGSGTPAPRVEVSARVLLDEAPNYAEILRHQWSEGVPPDVTAAERSVEYYGRLLETEPAQATTLSDCIALALQNNTDLHIQRLGPLSAVTGVRQARSQFDPRLFADITRDRLTTPAITSLTAGGAATLFTQNLSVNAGLRKLLRSGGQVELKWTNNRYRTSPSIANPLVPRNTTGLGLSLNQPLLRDFGRRYSLLLVEVAETTAESTYHLYVAGIASVITQVERTYWELVAAIENVRVQEQGLALAQELLRQNEGKFKVGTLPRTAVLEAQSEVARREASLIEARNTRDVARDNLRAVINYRKPDAAALLMIEPQDQPAVVPYAIDLERSLQTALERRAELIAARLDIHGRGLQRKIAENQLLPKLNFVGAIGLNGLSGRDAEATFNVGGTEVPVQTNPGIVGGYGAALDGLTDGRYYNYSAGATIEIPLANAQAKAEYAQANIDLEQSRLSLRKLEEGVTLEIKLAVSNLDSDLKSIAATRIARELAEENVRNQQARYDVGLATTKDLLDFQNQLTLARLSEVRALVKYNTDLAEMRRVEGTLLESRNVAVERVAAGHAPWWARF